MATRSTDKEFEARARFLVDAEKLAKILGVKVEVDWNNHMLNFIGDQDMVMKLLEKLEELYPDGVDM